MMEDFDFLDHSAIDYERIPVDQLVKMVYGPDLYKSTDALYEISRRDYGNTVQIAEDIFFNKKQDSFLQAQAVSILLNRSMAKTLHYITTHLQEFDEYNLWAIADFFYENPSKITENKNILLKLLIQLDKTKIDSEDDKYVKREWLRKHLS